MKYQGRVKAPVAGVEAFFVQADLSPDPKDGLICASADLFMDAKTCLAINATIYGWKGEMIGRYVYTDIHPNIGIKDEVFKIPGK